MNVTMVLVVKANLVDSGTCFCVDFFREGKDQPTLRAELFADDVVDPVGETVFSDALKEGTSSGILALFSSNVVVTTGEDVASLKELASSGGARGDESTHNLKEFLRKLLLPAIVRHVCNRGPSDLKEEFKNMLADMEKDSERERYRASIADHLAKKSILHITPEDGSGVLRDRTYVDALLKDMAFAKETGFGYASVLLEKTTTELKGEFDGQENSEKELRRAALLVRYKASLYAASAYEEFPVDAWPLVHLQINYPGRGFMSAAWKLHRAQQHRLLPC